MSDIGLVFKGFLLAVPCCFAFMLQFFGGGVTGGSIPAGTVAFQTGACPAGWSTYAAGQGRYIVGMPAAGTLGGTSGTALSDLEARAVGMHNHAVTDPGHGHGITDPGHDHTVAIPHLTAGVTIVGAAAYVDGQTATVTGGNTTGVTVNDNTTGVTVNNEGAVAGTNAPYIQLTPCVKN